MLLAYCLLPAGESLFGRPMWFGLALGGCGLVVLAAMSARFVRADAMDALAFLLLLSDFVLAARAGLLTPEGGVIATAVGLAVLYSGYLLARMIAGSQRLLKLMVIGLLVAGCVESALAVLQAVAPGLVTWTQMLSGEPLLTQSRGYLRPGTTIVLASGTFGNHLLLGNFLVFLLPCAVMLVPSLAIRRDRIVCAAAAGLISIGLLLTYSRQNMVGLAIAALYLLWVARPRWRLAAISVIVFVVAVTLGTTLQREFRQRATSYYSAQSPEYLVRVGGWKVATDMLLSNPTTLVVGSVARNTESGNSLVVVNGASMSSSLGPLDANSYLSVAVQRGVVGLGVLVGAIVLTVVELATVRRRLAGTVNGAVACGILAGLLGLSAALFFDNKYTVLFSLPKLLLLLSMGIAATLNSRCARNTRTGIGDSLSQSRGPARGHHSNGRDVVG